YFLDGEGNGMVSTIEEMKKPEVLIFKHLGMIKDGKEDLESEEVKSWSGSLEKYFLSQNGDTTTVKVELATLPEYIGMLKSGFVQGFEAVKQMAEK
ncbi:SRPBCC domain-containing protein, partial [Acinetobacter baumannii]|nr:SRPBCC domain-containing protein [Acinetobacter baumannii]ELC9314632.1 SRPBCC domain-containing protein [Acinetobacter baumannii]